MQIRNPTGKPAKTNNWKKESTAKWLCFLFCIGVLRKSIQNL